MQLVHPIQVLSPSGLKKLKDIKHLNLPIFPFPIASTATYSDIIPAQERDLIKVHVLFIANYQFSSLSI